MAGGWVQSLWWEKSPDELTQRRLPGLNMMAKNILIAALIIVIVEARQDQAPSYEELGENDLGFVSYSPVGKCIIQRRRCVHFRLHSRCLWIILREAFVKFRVEARPRQVWSREKQISRRAVSQKEFLTKVSLFCPRGMGKTYFSSTAQIIWYLFAQNQNIIWSLHSKIYSE